MPYTEPESINCRGFSSFFLSLRQCMKPFPVLSSEWTLATDMCYVLMGVCLEEQLPQMMIESTGVWWSVLKRWKKLHWWPHKFNLGYLTDPVIYFHVVYRAGDFTSKEWPLLGLYPDGWFVDLSKYLWQGNSWNWIVCNVMFRHILCGRRGDSFSQW